MCATGRADAVRAVSGLSDEQQAAAAVGHLRASGRRDLRTCHYTPPGRPCAVTGEHETRHGLLVLHKTNLGRPLSGGSWGWSTRSQPPSTSDTRRVVSVT